ncbi:LamG-like jellyroll fold domain-containing protein, partial [Kibdelosporangium aridum]|uniref:LamG-like jellyroll fold domain-containing protein n=1 Tax=Kibdelosporangium aridum TaxID=2030 RepID=UPI00135B119A
MLPERVRRGDQWVGVDTGLQTRPDGLVVPKATVSDVVFSGGGTGPLVRIASGGAVMALSWRGVLPKPVLAGDSVTYQDVLPGVDLRVRATLLGFGHDLVVKTPAAAANPALRKISFDLATTGATVSVDEHGNSKVVDASGKLVFYASPPRMRETPAVKAKGHEQPPAKSAPVGLQVAGGELSLVPDTGLMTDPDAGFPLVIDPDWSETTSFQSGWTLVRKALPNDAHFNIAARDEDERVLGVVRVGRAPDWPAQWIDRSLFRFDTRWVAGARIDHARIQLFQLWKNSDSCNPADVAPMEVRKTGEIGPSTTWNNQPAWGSVLDSIQSISKLGKCDPKWESLTVTSAVQETADARQDNVTLGIKATDADEASANPNGWKRFENALKDNQPYFPKLWMKYNHAPYAPSELSTDPPLPAPCFHCAGVSYVNNDRILLKARVTDPNGGQVRAIWDIATIGIREQWLASGSVFGTEVVLGRHQQGTFTWSVRSNDGLLDGPTVQGSTFAVDRVGPDKAPTVTADLYQADNAWYGGVGVPGAFRFDPSGVPDVDRYRYWFTGGNPVEVNAVTLGGGASVLAAPPKDGPMALFVQSVDRAGRPSATTEYHFNVRPGNGPKANWPLDGNAKDEALMGQRDGTVVGDVTWTPGASGAAARFTAAGGHITAANTVRTDEGFSVAAWVRLDRADVKSYAVVSQDGQNTCGLCLSYEGGTKSWAFVVPHQDSERPQIKPAVVRAPAAHHGGQWIHLVGVYDRAEGRIRLYVNGSYVGEDQRFPSMNATGLLRIGHQMGSVPNQFEGAIDDVRVYDRVLSTDAVRALVAKDDIQAAHWRFDEESGNTASNAVEGGDAAVLRGG